MIDVYRLVDTIQKTATECEACIEDTTETIISIKGKYIHGKREKKSSTYGLRTIIGKKKGFCAGTLPQPLESIEKAALKSAETAVEDGKWEHLPYSKKGTSVQGIYDKTLAEVPIEELGMNAAAMLEAADIPGVMVDFGKVSRSIKRVYLCNSHGVNSQYASTRLDVYFVCRCGHSDSTWGVHCSRQYNADFSGLAKDTAVRAQAVQNPRQLDSSFTGDAVFLAEPVEDILLSPLAVCVNAETADKTPVDRGNTVASDVISVYDDGTIPGGLGTAPVDGEGNPTQKTALITRGVLHGVLHSEYTSNCAHTDSTGNAVRKAVTEPKVGITNLVLTPGRTSIDELIQSVKKGVLIGDFTGKIDPFNGVVNGVIEHSFYIEKGEILYPVKDARIHGNVFELLKNVNILGKEQRTGENGVYAVPALVNKVHFAVV